MVFEVAMAFFEVIYTYLQYLLSSLWQRVQDSFRHQNPIKTSFDTSKWSSFESNKYGFPWSIGGKSWVFLQNTSREMQYNLKKHLKRMNLDSKMYPLVNWHNYGMAILNSHAKLPEGNPEDCICSTVWRKYRFLRGTMRYFGKCPLLNDGTNWLRRVHSFTLNEWHSP